MVHQCWLLAQTAGGALVPALFLPACTVKGGKKAKQTDEGVGRQHQRMDRPGIRQVTEGSGEQGQMEETGCEVIPNAPTTLAVKGHVRSDEVQ